MANLNLSNFIVDRILAGVGYRSDDSILFKLDQCQNTSITCGSESTDIVANDGSPIMTLYNAKTCEISGENAILDFNLTAVQMGTEKRVAGQDDVGSIVVPALEIVTAKDGKATLKHTPIKAPAFIYTLNKDSSLGDKFAKQTAASATEFAIDDQEITLPTGTADGTEFFVSYDYNSDAAIEIVNSARNFPKSCKLVLKAIGYNPCNKENMLGCYLIFNSFDMSPDFDLSLNRGDAQSWSGKASQDFCSRDKRLMSIVVVDDDDEMF